MSNFARAVVLFFRTRTHKNLSQAPRTCASRESLVFLVARFAAAGFAGNHVTRRLNWTGTERRGACVKRRCCWQWSSPRYAEHAIRSCHATGRSQSRRSKSNERSTRRRCPATIARPHRPGKDARIYTNIAAVWNSLPTGLLHRHLQTVASHLKAYTLLVFSPESAHLMTVHLGRMNANIYLFYRFYKVSV